MTDQRGRPKPGERVRSEVYGMPIDAIIDGAMAPEREAAARAAQAKAEATPDQATPVWPSLEDLKAGGPGARPAPRRRPGR